MRLDMVLGVNIQYYNPLIDDEVKAHFAVPESWNMVAQMVLGAPLPLYFVPDIKQILSTKVCQMNPIGQGKGRIFLVFCRILITYFVGDRIAGHQTPRVFMTREAAKALKEVSDDVMKEDFGIHAIVLSGGSAYGLAAEVLAKAIERAITSSKMAEDEYLSCCLDLECWGC
ncbi:hypothetical protein SELR_pSRC101460 (plasmid) [Selenomonas ruminantium subsp. lactilytica TAM6421]|uniref:Uncharacterized protein n=1 Tax=Selenomonas ruminantium subsp. lactilytica (strain NBRC 103574 / TAM6421) TaxID=927704 RepID=I0GW16_SELRL|nr:hypothetical protein SELR_pSRC101460 [Selenomonas ruminantium subsp. lactilytica TAM6421]